jgi:hypothetical protein
LDRDGDLDITITNKLFENIYLENHLEKQVEREQAHYLQVQVIGPQGDWGALAAKYLFMKRVISATASISGLSRGDDCDRIPQRQQPGAAFRPGYPHNRRYRC